MTQSNFAALDWNMLLERKFAPETRITAPPPCNAVHRLNKCVRVQSMEGIAVYRVNHSVLRMFQPT